MNNKSYIRLLSRQKAYHDRSYFNINIPSHICSALGLQNGDKIVIKQDNENIILRKVEL